MSLENKLKMVETGSTTFETNVVRTNSTLFGDKLKYTKADRTDLITRPFGNLFSSFNLPITDSQKANFTSGGIFYNTALSGINQDNVIIVEIPKNEYGELIDGKTISFTLPINGSGVTCYSTYFSDSSENTTNGNNKLSDASAQAAYFGIVPSAENGFNSNVSFLFSNSIKTPQQNTATTWNQWTTTNKFSTTNPLGSTTNKQFATFSSEFNSNNSNFDEVVGIAFLDKGFFVITHPTLVNNFSYNLGVSSGYDGITSGETYSGTSSFTQIYFTSTTLSNTSFTSIKTEFVQNIFAFAMMNEFYESENPTFLEVYSDGNPNNEPVLITEIGLYNEKMELIGIGKFSEPVPKNKNNVVTFNVQLKL
jgi:hypothetical protein